MLYTTFYTKSLTIIKIQFYRKLWHISNTETSGICLLKSIDDIFWRFFGTYVIWLLMSERWIYFFLVNSVFRMTNTKKIVSDINQVSLIITFHWLTTRNDWFVFALRESVRNSYLKWRKNCLKFHIQSLRWIDSKGSDIHSVWTGEPPEKKKQSLYSSIDNLNFKLKLQIQKLIIAHKKLVKLFHHQFARKN